MKFGSILADAGVCTLHTSDGINIKLNKTPIHRIALKIVGIPHIGHRMRAQKIFSLATAKNKARLLDAGCGDGLYSIHLAKRGFDTVGVDINEEKLKTGEMLAKRLHLPATFKKASLYNLPFNDGEFDMVLCTEVLEHLENDNDALAEISRVLKPGGLAIITFPTDTAFTRKIQHLLDHVRPGYTFGQAESMFKKNGLRIKEATSAMSTCGRPAWKMNRWLFKNKVACVLTFYPLYAFASIDRVLGLTKDPVNHIFLCEKYSTDEIQSADVHIVSEDGNKRII